VPLAVPLKQIRVHQYNYYVRAKKVNRPDSDQSLRVSSVPLLALGQVAEIAAEADLPGGCHEVSQ